MWSLTVGQLRHRRGRTLALLLGIVIATTGFTVLTGATTTSRLQTLDTVDANHRAAYDILVRPQGARTPLEAQGGLVRPNYLSGLHGGISIDQYEWIKQIDGVEVAAPIAMVGYTTTALQASIDVTAAVDHGQTRQTLRMRPRWVADRGLSNLDDDALRLVYLTKRPLVWPALTSSGSVDEYEDGSDHAADTAVCGPGKRLDPIEIQEDGSARALCQSTPASGSTGLRAVDRQRLTVVGLLPDGRYDFGPVFPSGEHRIETRLVIGFEWPMSLLLAGVDPEQEARLVGLDDAVASGRYLTDQDRPAQDELSGTAVPVIAPTRPVLDEQLVVLTDRVTGGGVGGMSAVKSYHRVETASGVRVAEDRVDANDVYRSVVGDELRAQLTVVVQAGSPDYEQLPDGSLRPRPVDNDPNAVWGDPAVGGFPVPWYAKDSAYRPLTKLESARDSGDLVTATAVGFFDPDKLRGFSQLSEVPLETYYPPAAEAADQRSGELLRNRPLVPNSNPGGYLATPPMMITSLAALPVLLGNSPQARAPVSAVRIRVAEVQGLDSVSRERVRLVAERIAVRTGLDVDVTIGASPAPQQVSLGGGTYGRPDLELVEGWSRKGVAVALVDAVDRKSAMLVVLILVVCVLFLANAVSAAVRDRRRELATLACLGWGARRLFGLLLGEVALVGLVAGVVGSLLAVLVSDIGGLAVSWPHALLAVPVALGVSVLAAAVPAARVARLYPGVGLMPAVLRSFRRPRRGHTFVGLALGNIRRTPGRTASAVLALAIGVCGAVGLVAILQGFRGAVVGTLLGDAVALQVRTVDLVAVGAVLLLGVGAVSDVLYIGVRERASEIGALRATGWTTSDIARLIGWEGCAIGVLGAAAGLVGGLAVVQAVVGGAPDTDAVALAVGVAGAAVVLAVAGAMLPAWLVGRSPIGDILGED